MNLTTKALNTALAALNMGTVASVAELTGGHAPVFRVEFSSGTAVVLKVYQDDATARPNKDAFAAACLRDTDLPVTRYLLVDESKTKLPFRFAVTNYLQGSTALSFREHPDISSLYRQTGKLLRVLHEIKMPAFGALGAEGIVDPVATNAPFVRRRIEHLFKHFLAMGGDMALTQRLRSIVEDQFDAIVTHSRGPVFAHDDMHPNNVLAVEDEHGKLVVSGLIDFGNAQAADPIFDLAKCLFCSEHDAPGSAPYICEGYGVLEHPNPEGAISYYSLVHRMTMWCWLRRTGVIPEPHAPSDLIDSLRQMAAL